MGVVGDYIKHPKESKFILSKESINTNAFKKYLLENMIDKGTRPLKKPKKVGLR